VTLPETEIDYRSRPRPFQLVVRVGAQLLRRSQQPLVVTSDLILSNETLS
jgi:hypothetical protein